MFLRRPVLLVAAAAAALSVTLATAPSAGAAVTVEGVVRTLAADTVDRSRHPKVFAGHSEDIYQQVLTVGSKTYFLKGKKAQPNTRVRVTGTVASNSFTASSIDTTGTVAGVAAAGSTRVLTMLAYWTAPDSVTPESARQQMLADSNGWYRDASYGQVGQVGDVTPWLKIAGPTSGCYADHLQLMSQAKSAAAALGYSAASYDNFVLYFPNCGGDAAGFAGWAYVGSTGTWLNGYMDRRASVHEQGHNYGLWHSHSHMCSGGGLTGSCAFTDYGDPYDAMGSSGYVGHFNGAQKSLLGWLDARTVDLSAGGSTTLVPMAADAAAPHAAVVALASGRTYWLEYRQPVDYDAGLPIEGTDGVLVHVTGEGSGSPDSGASLIDVRPADGISEYSSTLRAGQSWTTPEGTTISVGQVTASGAAVTVNTGPVVSVPTVTGKNPAGGATAVALGTATARTPLTATFSEPVTGVSGVSFTLKQGTTAVPALVTYDAATRVATLTPDAALVADTTYTLGLTSAITSASGGALADQTWSFVTGPRPTVTTTSPASGATGVSIGTSTTRTAVKATFSEAVSGVSGASFTLKQGTTAVAATVTYDAPSRVATLTPSAALVADRTYTVALTPAIKDGAGNPLSAKTWTFLTGPRPTVTTTSPASGATGVSIGTSTTRTPVKATFSEAVSGVSGASFTLKQGTTAVAATVTYDATSRVATLTPSAALAADKTYTVALTSAVKDGAGNPLSARTWTFLTGPRPTVTTKTPASGATGVSRTANVTATLSEAVTGLPTTAAASATFTIKRTSTGAAFTSVASYNTTSRVATLNPSGTLLANTQYTVTLSSGVKDLAGNPLTTLAWSFTTGA